MHCPIFMKIGVHALFSIGPSCYHNEYIFYVGTYSSPINALSNVLFPQLCWPKTLIQISFISSISLAFVMSIMICSETKSFPYLDLTSIRSLLVFCKEGWHHNTFHIYRLTNLSEDTIITFHTTVLHARCWKGCYCVQSKRPQMIQ